MATCTAGNKNNKRQYGGAQSHTLKSKHFNVLYNSQDVVEMWLRRVWKARHY